MFFRVLEVSFLLLCLCISEGKEDMQKFCALVKFFCSGKLIYLQSLYLSHFQGIIYPAVTNPQFLNLVPEKNLGSFVSPQLHHSLSQLQQRDTWSVSSNHRLMLHHLYLTRALSAIPQQARQTPHLPQTYQ